MKACQACGIEKELSEFSPRASARDGRRSECKSCRAYRVRLDRHSLTPAILAALVQVQGDSCGICRTRTPGGKGGWHIDHDHSCCPGKKSCGKCVRGLLCNGCNLGLGHFADDVERLLLAAEYLLATA